MIIAFMRYEHLYKIYYDQTRFLADIFYAFLSNSNSSKTDTNCCHLCMSANQSLV
jgi:hypothetical protein